ncbi:MULTISPECIES: cytochrome P450 [unclassified Nocardia]|uniref:cytochrome P450 n=1 Tax=unclassified Nocardia TaxID=2637762 RepID=UPI001CE46D8A|nr:MULTISPECIES: cytochrome P450 [unclassified Nocardia]
MTRNDIDDTTAIFHPDSYVRGVPHEAFARLRHAAAAVWVEEPAVDHLAPGPGFWAVLRHAEAQVVLRTPRLFSSSRGLTQIYDATPQLLGPLRRMMINMDPPDHGRIRGLLARSFTPRAVAMLEERIREHADRLVAAVARRGAADFARDIAADLPLLSLADLLGIPESDRWLMFDWSNRVIGLLDAEYNASDAFDVANASPMARAALRVRPQPDADGRMPDSRHPFGMADLYAYARALGEYRRRHPGDDIMSILLQQADRVTLDEFEQVFFLFSVAGNETVRNALPGGMFALLSHPDEYRRLCADPGLLDSAVEEMLRWWSPVTQFRRTADADTTLGDVPIEEGDKVVVFFASANRDERVFADPDRFDITRDPNPHLAFGHGPHFCIAAHLARTQMRAMFAAVLEQLGEVELAGEPQRLRSNFQNGIKHLPIEWRTA